MRRRSRRFFPPCRTGWGGPGQRLVQLLAEPDETVLPQALCAQQLRLLETCERYRRANVGTKHIFGLLSVSGVQAKVQK